MTRKINYEDDLFALSLIVRGLRDIARLEVDAELFAGRVADDALFADEAAVATLAALRASPFVPGRSGHLRALQKLMRALAALHGELAAGRTPLAAALAPRAAGLSVRAAARMRDAEELRILTAPTEEG